MSSNSPRPKPFVLGASQRYTTGDHLSMLSNDNQAAFDAAVFDIYNDLLRQLIKRAEGGSFAGVVKVDMDVLAAEAARFTQHEMTQVCLRLLNADGLTAHLVKESNRLIYVRWPREPELYTKDN